MSERESEFTTYELTKDNTLYSKVFGNENEDFQTQIDNLTLEDFVNNFQVKESYLENEEDKFDELKLYCTDKFIERETKKSIQNQITLILETKKFKTALQRKRGRQTTANDGKNAPIHDKCSPDNLKTKIQVQNISCIQCYINYILKQLGYKQQFLKLDYDFKKNVNNSFFEELKTKKSSEIICKNISKKYKKKDPDFNKKLYKQLKDDERLKFLFDVNYLTFFQNVYLEKNINFLNYELDKDINLSSHVKTFKDLIKNESKDYIQMLNSCIEQNFLSTKKVLFYQNNVNM